MDYGRMIVYVSVCVRMMEKIVAPGEPGIYITIGRGSCGVQEELAQGVH